MLNTILSELGIFILLVILYQKIVPDLIRKILHFTGITYAVLIFTFVGAFAQDILKNNFKPYGFIDISLSGIAITSCILVPIFTTIKNLIKLKKADFSYISLIKNRKYKRKEVGEKFEKVDKKFIGLENGIVLGKLKKNYLVMPQDIEGHIMVVGGQGSGKSSCVGIPTLLNYGGSVFAIDIKGELSQTCANYRTSMKIFDPINPDSPHYNPYAMLGDNKIQGAKEIVHSIIRISHNEKDPFWKQSAQNLLTACILHFENEGLDFAETCESIMHYPVSELVKILKASPVNDVQYFVNQFVGAEQQQLASIYSTLTNEIILFATDPDIKRVLGTEKCPNMITYNDLENFNDIFIKIDESKLDQWKPLLNLIVNQFLKSFEKRQDKDSKKILFMIDEFARLGKITAITNGLATLRSKGIQIMLILQSLAQLDMIYGKDNRRVITDNCNYKIILNANDADTQEYFSKLVGTVEVEKNSTSTSKKATDVINNNSLSKSTEEKRIIKPEAFAYLDKPVVFTPQGYFRPEKVKWYEDKIFMARANQSDIA